MVTGNALKGYWLNAVTVDPKPVVAFDWYRQFLQFLIDTQSYTWFAKFVSIGELLVGVALIIGAFVGVAAFFGALMNWNYLMAGTVSTNPILFIAAIVFVLAWKTAGYYGLDRWLLPMLGTPWKVGTLLQHDKQAAPSPKPVAS